MNKKLKIVVFILTIFVLVVSVQLPALAEHDASDGGVSTYEQFQVQYWPEHDSQSVLLIFRGLLPSDVKLPATVRIYVPKGARISSTAAVNSDGQYDYTETWKTHVIHPGEGDYDTLTFKTSSSAFQAEAYYNTISTDPGRELDLKFKTPVNINNLIVEIEKPVGAADFKVEPVSTDIQTADQFEYHRYSFLNIPADREFSYKVTYSKDNNTPSVNAEPGQINTAGDSNNAAAGDGSRTNMIIAIVLILGVIVTAIIVGVWRVRTVAAGPSGKQRKSSNYSSKPQAKDKPEPETQKFCGSCGEKLEAGAKFCGSCGDES